MAFDRPLAKQQDAVVAEQFDWVHTVDRLKIAERLSEQRPAELPPLQVCLQSTSAAKPARAACRPVMWRRWRRKVARLPRLRLRGLMGIPGPTDDRARQHAPYRALQQLLVAVGSAKAWCWTLCRWA